MPDVVTFPQALGQQVILDLRERALSSALVGESTLMGTFEESRGFGAIATREGLPKLRRQFPYFSPFLDLCEDRQKQAGLLPWPLRPVGRWLLPQSNAFYLNLLLISSGGAVGPHVDATLRDPSGSLDAVPNWVSVLYLQSPPELQGGRLCIHRGDYGVLRVKPQPGLFVHFRGELTHEVEKVISDEGGILRVSLILEQYTLAPQELARLPACQVQTREGFKNYFSSPL